MSEKRFKSTLDKDTMSIMPYLVSDKEEECFYNLEGCVDCLNEQQATIQRLEEEIGARENDIQILEKQLSNLREKIGFDEQQLDKIPQTIKRVWLGE